MAEVEVARLRLRSVGTEVAVGERSQRMMAGVAEQVAARLRRALGEQAVMRMAVEEVAVAVRLNLRNRRGLAPRLILVEEVVGLLRVLHPAAEEVEVEQLAQGSAVVPRCAYLRMEAGQRIVWAQVTARRPMGSCLVVAVAEDQPSDQAGFDCLLEGGSPAQAQAHWRIFQHRQLEEAP
jgi:hypothetical protein